MTGKTYRFETFKQAFDQLNGRQLEAFFDEVGAALVAQKLLAESLVELGATGPFRLKSEIEWTDDSEPTSQCTLNCGDETLVTRLTLRKSE